MNKTLVKIVKALVAKKPEVTNINISVDDKLKQKMADRVRSLLLESPVTPEDEGYNDGIEAAMRKILE